MPTETENALEGIVSEPSTEGIYWPTDPTGSFYWKHGAAYLNPNVIPEGQQFSNSIVEKALQNVSEEVRQDILAKGVFSPPRMTPQDQATNKYGISWNPEDLGPEISSPEIYQAEKGLPESFRPEGVDPYRSLTQRALDMTMGFLDPKRFGKQAISPKVIPTGWDEFYTDPVPKPMTGSEAIEKFGPLTSSTRRSDGSIPQPGDPDWRGYDLPLGDIRRGGPFEAFNPARLISNIPGIDALRDQIGGWGAQKLISSPQAAALAAAAALVYGGYRGLQAWGEKGAGEARVSEPLIDYPTNIHPPIQSGGGRRGGFLEGIFPGGAPTSLLPEQPSLRGLGYEPERRGGYRSIPISHTGGGVGGDEISTTVDVMPMISGEQLLQDQGITPTMPVINPYAEPADADLTVGDILREQYNPRFVDAQELIPEITPEVFDDFVTSSVLGIDIPQPAMESEVMDITSQVESFSAIRDRAAEDQRQRDREQDQREERLEKAADDRRKSEQQARVEAKASAAAKRAETRKIASENKARKAEEKRIASKQASEEKQRRAVEKQMADMLKQAEETRQAYLERKRQEEDRRRRAGFGVGAMWT